MANRQITPAQILQHLNGLYEGEGMLPSSAEAQSRSTLSIAADRLKAKGYTPTSPNAEQVLRGWTQYCEALMRSEGVQVADIRGWWSFSGLLRESWVVFYEFQYARTYEAAKSAGHDDDFATRYAWKHSLVFGDSSGGDRDYSPLPPELMLRSEAFFADYAHPFDHSSLEETLALPTLNGYVRQQVRARAL
jgi:hypothetical protein